MNSRDYLLTVAYANQNVLETSYAQLRRTTVNNPLNVLMFDNCYPMNWIGHGHDLAIRNQFQYYTHGVNIGLYPALEYLISKAPEFCEKLIFYDGDNYPTSPDWHIPMLKLLDDPEIVHVTLMNNVIMREFTERGVKHENILGYNCFVAQQAMTNTTCALKTSFLREIGGFIGGKKYYGGNEIAMWPHYRGRKWVFLADFWENNDKMMGLHDWQYQQYKLLYAHKNMDMTFESYIKTNPERIYDLEKQIFG